MAIKRKEGDSVPPQKPLRARFPPVQLPWEKRVSSKDVHAFLSNLGKGWNDGVANSIAAPDELFEKSGPTSRFFSAEPEFPIAKFIVSLRTGPFEPPNTNYGIATYETTGTVYFVLVDMARRIVVRERLVNYHSDPPEQDWSVIRKAIESAESFAKKSSAVAMWDGGTLRAIG